MGYKVDYDALDALYNNIHLQTDSWDGELSSVAVAVDELASSSNMSGSGSLSIKAYLQSVHIPILKSLSELLAFHDSSCLIYKQDYQSNVDTSLRAVIEEDELISIQEELEKNRSTANSIYNEVEYSLNRIRDIFFVNYRDVSGVEAVHETETDDIQQLDKAIQQLESKHSVNDFVETEALLQTLSAFVQEMTGKGRAYKTNFTAKSLARSSAYLALIAARISVEAKQRAKAEEIERANENEQKRIGELDTESALSPGVIAMGAVLTGGIGSSGKILGINSGASAEYSALSGKVSKIGKAKWTPSKGEAGAEVGVKAAGDLVSGEAKGNIGLLQGKIQGSIGHGEASGSVGATLYKNGKLSPTLEAKAKAEVSAATGEAEVKFGNENVDAHAKAQGSLGHAEAEASGGVGKITVKDSNGNETTGWGVKGQVKAEVCAAEGKVSGGFTILGIKINAGIKGKAGALGVEAGGGITTSGVSGQLGGSLGVGLGVEFSIDWSGFKLW